MPSAQQCRKKCNSTLAFCQQSNRPPKQRRTLLFLISSIGTRVSSKKNDENHPWEEEKRATSTSGATLLQSRVAPNWSLEARCVTFFARRPRSSSSGTPPERSCLLFGVTTRAFDLIGSRDSDVPLSLRCRLFPYQQRWRRRRRAWPMGVSGRVGVVRGVTSGANESPSPRAAPEQSPRGEIDGRQQPPPRRPSSINWPPPLHALSPRPRSSERAACSLAR